MTAPPLRVALLTPCYWPEVRRGAERITRELADGLIERGHRPRLITSHRGRPGTAVEDGLPVTRVFRPPDGRLRRRRFEDHMTHVPLSYRELRRGDDDVALAVYPTDALAAARWTAATGRPSVLAYMGIPDHPGLCSRRLRLEITLRATGGCSAVTALSRTAAEAFSRWLGVEARVISPGVDLEAFSPASGRSESPTIFCAAAASEPRKRVPLLIDAFRLVRRERRDARLVLIRPGDPRLATALAGAADGVELADPVEDPRALAGLYRGAWVSTLPSTGDSFGVVLVESLACGTPVVASNSHALPEVVDRPQIGRVFSGADAGALSQALLEALDLSSDPATAAACRQRAEDFGAERTTAAYESLFRELVGAVAR